MERESSLRSPIDELANANEAVERHLRTIFIQGRAEVAQDVIQDLRHLVEHVAMFAVHGSEQFDEDYYSKIKPALSVLKRRGTTKFIWEFHHLLQKVVSHYVPYTDASERLMLAYYEELILLRDYARKSLRIDILSNLELFPVDIDSGLKDYYDSVARQIDQTASTYRPSSDRHRFYIRRVRPFFSHGRVYYEMTLLRPHDISSKFDHIVAFSRERIPTENCVLLSLSETITSGFGAELPISIVLDWSVSVRPCELKALLRVFGFHKLASKGIPHDERGALMRLMTSTRMSMAEIAVLPSKEYENYLVGIARDGAIRSLLDAARRHLTSNCPGSNVLRYLLHRPRNRVIKDQLQERPNNWLGNLYLQNGCIPFDKQPYCMSLLGHEVVPAELLYCIDPSEYEDDHLARTVRCMSNDQGALYICEKDLQGFVGIDRLIESHNGKLYRSHLSRASLVHEMGQVFFNGDENDAASIMRKLRTLSESGLVGYGSVCESWLDMNSSRIDDPCKEKALKEMFADTSVSLIYGAAGTGKTTMIDLVCALFPDVSKIAIACTNPAVDNLKRRIHDTSCEFMTIAKYLSGNYSCDILIVDECSTVSNRDMCKILSREDFKTLLLVGDVCQLESIRFGNWFNLARQFLPEKCIHEFTEPWRAANGDLARLWDAVRRKEPEINELLCVCKMGLPLEKFEWKRESDDEVVLCLNYDGPFGVSSINRLLQAANPNEEVLWGQRVYKVGDPILFDDSRRFSLLYNNLKGTIEGIEVSRDCFITFKVSVDASITALSVKSEFGLTFEGNQNGKTLLSFSVFKDDDPDGDGEGGDCERIVPFQVAYAASVHKAQGLEYSSVKLIITRDVEERITHSVFYTAITRAREKLKIYWSPETQAKVIAGLIPCSTKKDAYLLKGRCGL